MIKLITHLLVIWRFRQAQHIYHFWDTDLYLLASSNLAPWHLVKSHPISAANSSRVTYPHRLFYDWHLLWDHSGPSSPERSDGSTAAVRMNGSFPSSGLMWRIQFLWLFLWAVGDKTHRWEQIFKSVSTHRLRGLLHVLNSTCVIMSCSTVTNLHRRWSHSSLRGISPSATGIR